METTCPTPYLPPGCWDLTKAAGSDATLAGLLAVIAVTIIVLVVQAPKRSSSEREKEMRNIVLSALVGTFLSALFASFILGLLAGEMPTFRAEVLLVLASPALVVAVLQFLLSLGWLLTSHQAGKAPLSIARWAFLLVNGLIIVYLALDWADLLELKTPGIFPIPLDPGAGILVALVISAIVWVITIWRKRKFSSEESTRRQEGANYMQLCAKSGLLFAAGCTLLYGIFSSFSAPFLQSGPDWAYYLGVVSLIVPTGWFVYVSEMSWPTPPPAPSHAPQEDHAEATLNHNLSGETTPPPLEESTPPSAKKRPMKKAAPVQEKETTKQAPVNQ